MEVSSYLQLIYATLLLFSTLLLVASKSRKYTNNKCIMTKPIPKPPGSLPIIGHLHLLGGHGTTIHRNLGAMADKFGPIFALKLGQHKAIVLSNWELVKDCFTNNDTIFATRPSMAISKYLYYDFAAFFISPYGRYWREIRKISATELFSNKRLEKMKHVRVFEVNYCLKGCYKKCMEPSCNETKKVEISLGKWFECLGFNIALSMIVGKRYSPNLYNEKNKIASQFKKAISRATLLSGLPVFSDYLPKIEWMDFRGYIGSMKDTHKEIDTIIGQWLDEHIQKRQEHVNKGLGTGFEDSDLMDVMLSNVEEQFATSNYTKETIIKATAVTLLLTGSESTSITLTWAASLLLNHPEVLKLAQEEMDLKIGKQRWVEESDITNLPYLQAIVKETLRMYPPSPLTGPREAMEDCHINGYFISKGTRLIVNIWKLHRDPTVWVEPDKFRPERFFGKHENINYKLLNFDYTPFGVGRRSCPGMNLGLHVVHLMLARLIQGFNMWAKDDDPIDMTEGLGLALPKTGPLDVILSPRLPSDLYEAL